MGERTRRRGIFFSSPFLLSFLGWSSLVGGGGGIARRMWAPLFSRRVSVVAPAGVARRDSGRVRARIKRSVSNETRRSPVSKRFPRRLGSTSGKQVYRYGRTVIPVPRPIPSAFPSTSIAANPLFARPPLPPEIGKLFRFENRDSPPSSSLLCPTDAATKEEIN